MLLFIVFTVAADWKNKIGNVRFFLEEWTFSKNSAHAAHLSHIAQIAHTSKITIDPKIQNRYTVSMKRFPSWWYFLLFLCLTRGALAMCIHPHERGRRCPECKKVADTVDFLTRHTLSLETFVELIKIIQKKADDCKFCCASIYQEHSFCPVLPGCSPLGYDILEKVAQINYIEDFRTILELLDSIYHCKSCLIPEEERALKVRQMIEDITTHPYALFFYKEIFFALKERVKMGENFELFLLDSRGHLVLNNEISEICPSVFPSREESEQIEQLLLIADMIRNHEEVEAVASIVARKMHCKASLLPVREAKELRRQILCRTCKKFRQTKRKTIYANILIYLGNIFRTFNLEVVFHRGETPSPIPSSERDWSRFVHFCSFMDSLIQDVSDAFYALQELTRYKKNSIEIFPMSNLSIAEFCKTLLRLGNTINEEDLTFLFFALLQKMHEVGVGISDTGREIIPHQNNLSWFSEAEQAQPYRRDVRRLKEQLAVLPCTLEILQAIWWNFCSLVRRNHCFYCQERRIFMRRPTSYGVE